MNAPSDPSRTQRIELIVQKLDTVPSPSPIALRLLSLASNDEVDMSEIVRLIESDAAMTARLLTMCSRSTTGLGDSITTVDCAVVMLGLDAVRAMLLSVDVHEFMTSSAQNDLDDTPIGIAGSPERIDRVELWRHALGVACAAEQLTVLHADRFDSVKPDEAFVCGLLHDIGKIALDALLPRSLAKAVQIARRRCQPLASIERSLIGIDHAGVGKRLAEKWGLAGVIRDVIWLHGRPSQSLPDLPCARMIGVVSAANEIARLMHVGDSGNGALPMPISRIAEQWNLDAARVEQVAVSLHERVSERSQQLGVDEAPPAQWLIQSLGVANRTLVRFNEMHRRRSRGYDRLESTLEALCSFSESLAAAPSQTPIDVFTLIVQSGRQLYGGQDVIAAFRLPGDCWTLCMFDNNAQLCRTARASVAIQPVQRMGQEDGAPAFSDQALGEIASALEVDEQSLRRRKLLTLQLNDAGGAWMLHGWRLGREQDVAVAHWRAAMAGALNQAHAAHLSEEFAEMNRQLACAQDRTAEMQSYARLGELAAGAAHEMNNPLAVISGRAQLLRGSLSDDEQTRMIDAIISAASQLSKLIENMHFVASPQALKRSSIDLTSLVPKIIKSIRRQRAAEGFNMSPIRFIIRGPLPPAFLDIDLFSVAVEELIHNAVEANESHQVEVRIQTEPADDRLLLSVLDDGAGLTPQVIAHAADPFFSSKEAGRQTGMGLAKARRAIEMHGGRLELFNRAEGGAEARITLERWRFMCEQPETSNNACAA